jgi:sucrose-6-phosphate hydrolase SacC (GH32 family)
MAALSGGKGRGYSMARTLGSDPNQVAVEGRRTVVAWVSAAFTSQSLLQDITLGKDNQLRQTFVPELEMLRTGSPTTVSSTVAHGNTLQFELLATVKKGTGPVGVDVLVSKDGASKATIAVDFDSEIVMVDATSAGNSDIRAGPLLGDTDAVTIHAYVDHSIIAVIFNNRTSLTVAVKPAQEDADGVQTVGSTVSAVVHKLESANQNDGACSVLRATISSANPADFAGC